MPKIELSTLEDISLNQAFENEAHDFNPWLAENLSRLARVLGVVLESPDLSVRVERFRPDIVAKDAANGSTVIIESQFGRSDHRHLGQILTYAAGQDGSLLVWIAEQFEEPHLATLRWLNERTDARVAFFAIRARIVQIHGQHVAAPLFEIVVRPDDWGERAEVAEPEETPQSSWKQEFWGEYCQFFPEANSDRGAGKGGANRWRSVPGTPFIISRWLTPESVGLFVRGERGVPGEPVFEKLAEFATDLEREIGAPLGENPNFAFPKRREGRMEDHSAWEAAIRWLEHETRRYVEVLTPKENVDIDLKENTHVA